SATTGGSAAIGAAVAITLANVTNEARSDGLTSSIGLTLTADAPSSSDLAAHATSGAGSAVGIAGSLALVIGNLTTTAGLEDPAAISDVHAGGASFTATSNSTSSAVADAATTGGSSVGIGASVALSIVTVKT